MPFAQFYGALHTISTFDTGTTELPTSLNAPYSWRLFVSYNCFFIAVSNKAGHPPAVNALIICLSVIHYNVYE